MSGLQIPFNPVAIGSIPATATSPAIVNGKAVATTYPGVSTGVLTAGAARQANGVALQAFLDWCITNGYPALFPSARYEYEASATANGRNTGLHAKTGIIAVLGDSSSPLESPQMVQYATNHPVLTFGDLTATTSAFVEGAVLDGFVLGHGVSQTGQTSADGILFGRCWGCSIDNILVTPFLDGTNPPYIAIHVGLGTTTQFFSNNIGTVRAYSAQQHLFRQDAASTGNSWQNIYLGSGTFGNRVATAAEPFWANMSGSDFGSIAQLNIEWCQSANNGALLRSEATNMLIGHLHFEGAKLIGFDPKCIWSVVGRIHINSMKSLDVWIAAANASGTPQILSAYGDARIIVDQALLNWQGAGVNAEAVASMAFRLYSDDATVVGRKPFATVRQTDISGNTGAMSLDANLAGAAPGSAGAILGFDEYSFNKGRSQTEGAIIQMGNANMSVFAAHRRAKVVTTGTFSAGRTLSVDDRFATSGVGAASKRMACDLVAVHNNASTQTVTIAKSIHRDIYTTIALATVLVVGGTEGLAAGDLVTGVGIAGGASIILTVDSPTQVTVTAVSTATARVAGVISGTVTTVATAAEGSVEWTGTGLV